MPQNNKPNNFLFKYLDKEKYEQALNFADEIWVNKAVESCFNVNKNYTKEQFTNLENVIQLYELYIIDLQAEISNNGSNDIKLEYYTSCNILFRLYRSLTLPQDSISKIKYVYKLISYAYLGQSWESGKRYIMENYDNCIVKDLDSDSWDIKVFKNIYTGFINLIIKENADYLNSSIESIKKLKVAQNDFEQSYLNNLNINIVESRSYELIGLYHFAKTIEILSEFMLKGNTQNVRELLERHFREAIKYAEMASNIEMVLILQLLSQTFEQMVKNSIWMITKAVNSRVTKFVNSIINSDKPMYELLYPQRTAILEEGLFDVAHNAIVVNLPTSSGKTKIAEFKILQTLNLFENGWIVYVAPTKALVNQVFIELNHDFKDIGVRVQRLSGAMTLDIYDENILDNNTDQNSGFDVLVVTPEKLNLLIRQNIEAKLKRPLVLTIIDEAHNIESKDRGLNYEMLLANISNDCPKSKFLLLTPFIKNANQIAEWLDKDSPCPIQLAINWKPNDKIIGVYYTEGEAREWNTKFDTFLTSSELIKFDKKLEISQKFVPDFPISSNNKTKMTAIVATQLKAREGILIVCRTPDSCWKMANELYKRVDKKNNDDEQINLVKKYISAEIGNDLPLNKYLDKRIGIHHAGISDEMRFLMEWLMVHGKLDYLIATTTIAQGINFPVSTILMQSYSYPLTEHMPINDFLNLVGRAGRAYQDSLGLVGIASMSNSDGHEYKKIENFVNTSAETLYSNLVKLLNDIQNVEDLEFDTKFLYRNPVWSQFLQYITHMYNQIHDVQSFSSEIDIILRKTLGYTQISKDKQYILISAVKNYILRLDEKKGLSQLSDSTGFSFETIKTSISKLQKLNLSKEDWSHSNLFGNENKLKDIMGIMIQVPEIRSNLKEGQDINLNKNRLSNIIKAWVNGEKINIIAERYFKTDAKSIENSISECYRRLNRDITYAATWGLSSLQRMSGLNFDEMSEEELMQYGNTAAMIYYGVNSDEAILMRKNNIPRSISAAFGLKYKSIVNNIYSVTPADVQNWLISLDDRSWNEIVPKNRYINGSEYKKIWEILNFK